MSYDNSVNMHYHLYSQLTGEIVNLEKVKIFAHSYKGIGDRVTVNKDIKKVAE